MMSCLTPHAPDKCGALPVRSGSLAPKADSASGGFIRQVPPLPVTPAVRRFATKDKEKYVNFF
jgi:hypothetical protein